MDTAQFFCPNKDSKRQLVGVHRRMVFGSMAESRECFQDTPLSLLLTTNHIERDHFACRLPNSRLVRCSISYSKTQAPLQWPCDLEDLYPGLTARTGCNFCLGHSSLRRELPEPIPTRGSGSLKKWEQRTPAMAEGIADHIMTLDELLSIPVSPELCHNDRGP